MQELPEEAIEVAEDMSVNHSHEGMEGDAERLLEHLRSVHALEVPLHVSGSTQRGLHDRLHHEADAGDR